MATQGRIQSKIGHRNELEDCIFSRLTAVPRQSKSRRWVEISDGFSEFNNERPRHYAARTFFDGVFFPAFLGVLCVAATFPKVLKDEAKISRCAVNQCASASPSWRPFAVHR
jgi:hypothetical protein